MVCPHNSNLALLLYDTWPSCCYRSGLCHQMETFSTLLVLCEGNSPVTSGHHKGQWRRALMFSLICAWINGRVNNRDAGDLKRHRAHYDVTVMFLWLPRQHSCCVMCRILWRSCYESVSYLAKCSFHLIWITMEYHAWNVPWPQLFNCKIR